MTTPASTYRAIHYTRIDGRPDSGRLVAVHAAVGRIRSARNKPRVWDAVHVYETTAHDGTRLHIAYLHYLPGYWTGVSDAIDIYEIPTAALTNL